MKKGSKRYSKTYQKIFFSYIIIFLVPLLTGVLFYMYSYHTTKMQTDESNRRAVQTIKQNCDKEIGSYMNNMVQVALNREVQILSASSSFKDSEFYTLYSLYDELENIKGTCNIYKEYCEDVFVYFQNNEKMVSSFGNMPLSMYYELYGKNSTMTEEQMEEYLSGFHYYNAIRLEADNPEETGSILLTMTNMNTSWGLKSAVAGVSLSDRVLNDTIDSLKWQGGDVLVLDSENRILNRSAEQAGRYQLLYEDLVPGAESQIVLDGERYIVRTEASDLIDWKYISLLPEDVVSEPARQVRNVFMIESMICIIVGFVVSWQMTRINYNPLENLVNIMHLHKTGEEDDAESNEYLYLQKKTKSLMKEHADFKHMMTDNQKIIHQYYLIKLLEASYDESRIQEQDKGIRYLKEGKNMVLLLQAEGEEARENSEESSKTSSLKKFIIENVLLEELGDDFFTEIVDIGERLVVVVHFKEEANGKERLAEAVDTVQQFIYQNFKFHVVALAGSCYEGLEGVHQSYIEARDLVELVPQLESDYLSYEEVKNSPNKNYYYPIDMESKVISAMQSGNVPVAMSYIRSVLETNSRQIRNSPMMKRCLFYDILGTILKTASDMGVKNVDEYEKFSQLTSHISFAEMSEVFENLIQTFCDEYSQKEEVGGVDSGNQLSVKVMEYIRENYQNPDLNISQTGLYFHMTPAYLSMLFKKQTGDSLLKFITQVRVDAARELLEEGKNVSEVAEMVGFRDVSTFIRVFKKATGVTPGQIRQK